MTMNASLNPPAAALLICTSIYSCHTNLMRSSLLEYKRLVLEVKLESRRAPTEKRLVNVCVIGWNCQAGGPEEEQRGSRMQRERTARKQRILQMENDHKWSHFLSDVHVF